MKTVKTRTDLLELLPKGLVIAELGVFVGDFSREILDICKPIRFFMVDLFTSGPCYSGDKDGLNDVTVDDLSIYFEILSQRYMNQSEVSVVRGRTVDFLHLFSLGSLDVVYIDASHLYADVLADLYGSYGLIKSGWIMGHDYNFEQVRKAVDEFCTVTGLEIDVLTEDGCPSYMIRV